MGFISRMMRRADERRRRRERMEEIASWVMLPIIALICYGIYREVWPVIKKPVTQFMTDLSSRQRQ